MSEPKHTPTLNKYPTPWRLEMSTVLGDSRHIIDARSELVIDSIPPDLAALIVTAVNAHVALVAVAKDAEFLLRRAAEDREETDAETLRRHCCEVADRARAALRLVRGEE